MTGDPLPGFGRVRRRIGPSRRQVDVTLSAWRRAGLLAGDDHAAFRSTLRDAAEAVDAARDALREGTGSAYTLTMTTRALFDMLAAVRPLVAPSGGDDDWTAFLDAVGRPTVRDDATP